ncbi:MAG: SpoIIE family protein phosphatase [Deltaproteobacteria bacterium]|nr:MAG: SpoIIE family protein phosphatase [Deltaproteobacteria bacterium]
MKAKEHFKSWFCFWKPSVARKITFYFLIFGLIIFVITSVLYMVAAKKHFTRATSQLIQHQFARLENSGEPDFIWQAINHPQPGLYDLMQLLTNISSSFYSIVDMSIYSKVPQRDYWYRLSFDDTKVLRAGPIRDSATDKLERKLRRRFKPADMNFLETEDALSMFVDISRPNDINQYFLKIEMGIEGFAAIMRREVIYFVLMLIAALIFSRFLGYYFARKIAHPIEELSKFATDVAKGDLSKFAPVSTHDEIGQLAKNFNTMIDGLREWERIKIIEFELEKGQQIQREFLPSSIPHLPDWDVATCFYPAGKVSGDFYDIFVLSDGCVGLVIADVCDKGVGSALYMALFRSLIRVFAEQAAYCTGPALTTIDQACGIDAGTAPENAQLMSLRAIPFTNNYIAQTHGEESMFATMFFGVLNPATGKLCYINGGHEPLYVISTGGIKTNLKPTGPAVGMMPNSAFDIRQIQLDPGDVLIGYTDGVIEARSPADELFTRNRLLSILEQPVVSVAELLERVKKNLFAFIDVAPRNDDVTMLAVQRSSVTESHFGKKIFH